MGEKVLLSEREKWLLVFLDGPDLAGGGGKEWVDPIRIQKGMFLLSMRGPSKELFEFSPYHWGPFSKDVTETVRSLVKRGLAVRKPVEGRSWSVYSTTDTGHSQAVSYREALSESHRGWIDGAREYVLGKSFVGLLREIYDAYPDYASRSLLAP
ncbi:MAG: hypothetical protein IH942_02800 [Acidobacteria bacterium]|nr:hypothetical protein [Acidobacteriota bacterium]